MPLREAQFGPPGVALDTLEPIFENLTPMRHQIDLVRAVVWATDEIRAARIIRVSPLKFVRGESKDMDVEEMPRPITYNASVGLPHSLGGLTVFSATWIAGPGESKAHYLDRRDFFQYFTEDEAKQLPTPEDVFETYDDRMRTQYKGHTASIGRKENLSSSIFTADGLKLLASTAPVE